MDLYYKYFPNAQLASVHYLLNFKRNQMKYIPWFLPERYSFISERFLLQTRSRYLLVHVCYYILMHWTTNLV